MEELIPLLQSQHQLNLDKYTLRRQLCIIKAIYCRYFSQWLAYKHSFQHSKISSSERLANCMASARLLGGILTYTQVS